MKWRCACEPIHVPGSIQPHGILVALDERDLTITHASANIEAMLAVPFVRLRGARLSRLFDPHEAERLEAAIVRGDPLGIFNPMQFRLVAGGRPTTFECVVHRAGGFVIIELEPYDGPAAVGFDIFGRVRTSIARMEAAHDLTTLVTGAAADVRVMSGFDRAMVYRFDEDWNGDVLAESTSTRAPREYLGLRFPAGDIPDQARLLYLKNPLRLIADVDYEPSPLLPGGAAPLDLSRSVLRGISPVHIEYLKNIGARATLTISIVVGERLWGLIACHHLEPRRVDFATRASCEFFGQMLAWQLASREQSQALQNELWAASLMTSYDKSLVSQKDLAGGMFAGTDDVLALFAAQGVAIRYAGTIARAGVAPADDATCDAIAQGLAPFADAGIAGTHRLAESVPHVAARTHPICGALLITLGDSADEYVLVFRTEVVASINWGGDIRFAITESDGKLHPRKSFALWKEIVRGQSRRWSNHDVANARTLRGHVFERSRAIERQAADERIRFLAHHDALTQLPNRASFNEQLIDLVARAERTAGILAVLFVDLDHFKVYNDSFGHAMGDAILQTAAIRLRECVRHDDVVARLGGDEFVIILSDLSKEGDADAVARKVLDAVAEPFVTAEGEIQFTASVGIALYPRDAREADALLKHADLAMYRAKEGGRNGFQRFDAGDASPTYERLSLERRIDNGLEKNEFVPFYQPIVDAMTGAVVAFEALARWEHPERGLLPPSEFIALAEQSRSIVTLGRVMLRSACEHVAQWRSIPGCETLRVTVNVSARQFREAEFLATVRETLAETGLRPDALQLEVTESFLIGDEEYAIRTLRALAEDGISIAIDDFGTGYSSLSYLTRLPVDVLKIDQSFVRNMTPHPHGATIVRAIIAMAHTLNLSVVAEGVETDEQRAFLRDEGCDKIQGYLIAKPLAHRDASAFIGVGQPARTSR